MKQQLRRVIQSKVSIRAAVRVLDTSESEATLRTAAYALQKERVERIHTDYGDLVETMRVEKADGTFYEGPYINPHALLHHASGVSVHASRFFA